MYDVNIGIATSLRPFVPVDSKMKQTAQSP